MKQKTEIIRFCLVGGATFIIDYALLYILTEYINLNYLLSSGLSFTAAVLANYFLCLAYVFTDSKNGTKQFMLFILSSIGGLIINQLCMYFFVEIMFMYYMAAKIIATIIVTIWNYITKKKSLEYAR